jgi:hypothetical protein
MTIKSCKTRERRSPLRRAERSQCGRRALAVRPSRASRLVSKLD